jgi:transketolase
MKTEMLTSQEIKELSQTAKQARAAILKMTTNSMSGHPGGSMSCIDILLTLYKLMNIDPANPKDETRDRLVVSNGHISPGVYSALGLNGFINLDQAITEFRLAGSIFEGHIETDVPGVEWGTGNLGQGLSAACGFALGCKLKGIENHHFVLMGDGEQQKGQLSEARRFAVKYNLNNITAIVDFNELQIGGDIQHVMPQNITENYLSDGWEVIEIDGHDFIQIEQAILNSIESDCPTMILAKTTMGKSVSFMENKEKYHGSTLNEEQLADALAELKQENNFETYKQKRATLNLVKPAHSNSVEFDLEAGNPRVYTDKTDNRSAWGNALADLAESNINKNTKLAVFDCDLQGSVKTNAFEKVMPNNFFQGGIMEHNTATMAGTLSYEGIQTFFADFGVFGVDEVYNQQRLNDINNANVKIITTHVGLDVGEDGKTHQCIDYLGLMKNLYHFPTFVPADPNQTDRIIRYIGTRPGNFLVPMGRSKLEIIKKEDGTPYFDENYTFVPGKAEQIRKGSKAAVLVMGTLAPATVQAIDNLAKDGIDVALWNIATPTMLDKDALKQAAATGTIFTVEDHNVNTGLGNSVADQLFQMQTFCKLIKIGVEDYACSGSANDVYALYGLDAKGIETKIRETLS